MFYIKVEDEIKSQMFMLVDGLQFMLGQGDQYFSWNGDYPAGTYAFNGEITAGELDPITPMVINITFAKFL